ncbi:14 kDa phosphohistidine phosphatase isoform X3 [Hydra vulgaris]|nr:14 kDa phosphohistidine phosphatase isoform X2 [Hydra vulgaris]
MVPESTSSKLGNVEDVVIDDHGKFKYILIQLREGSNKKIVVRGFHWAEYHADIYEKEEQSFAELGIHTECLGGGRIDHDKDKKMILVYGYSVGFGRADHSIAVELLKLKFPHYTKISYTNEGY